MLPKQLFKRIFIYMVLQVFVVHVIVQDGLRHHGCIHIVLQRTWRRYQVGSPTLELEDLENICKIIVSELKKGLSETDAKYLAITMRDQMAADRQGSSDAVQGQGCSGKVEDKQT